MLSTLKRTQVSRGRWTAETGLTLRVITDSSRRLLASVAFRGEGKATLIPVKDMSRRMPANGCVAVFNRQGVSLGSCGIRRRSHEKDLRGTVSASSDDVRVRAMPGLSS
jgi:hypothetical protein